MIEKEKAGKHGAAWGGCFLATGGISRIKKRGRVCREKGEQQGSNEIKKGLGKQMEKMWYGKVHGGRKDGCLDLNRKTKTP